MKSYFICIIMFSIILYSCKKDNINPSCDSNCVILTGTVFEGTKNLTVPDVTIKVKWSDGGSYFGPSGTRVIGETKTDANGNYTIRFTPREGEMNSGNFIVLGSKDGYIYTESVNEKYLNSDSIIIDTPYYVKLNLYPKILLNLKLTALNPQNTIDYFSLTYRYTTSGLSDFSGNYNLEDTTIQRVSAGDEYTFIEWRVNRDTVVTYIKDTVFCPKGVTTTHEIKF